MQPCNASDSVDRLLGHYAVDASTRAGVEALAKWSLRGGAASVHQAADVKSGLVERGGDTLRLIISSTVASLEREIRREILTEPQ
jgi:hypothetical protein